MKHQRAQLGCRADHVYRRLLSLTAAVFSPACLPACLPLHVTNLTKLFRLNQYLWRGRGREEGSA